MRRPGMSRAVVPWPLRRFLHLRRRSLAALAAAVAVLATLSVLAPRPPELTSVVVAARDLPGGTVLVASDLTTLPVAPGTFPDDVLLDPATAVGRTLNGPASARTPITATALAEGQRLARDGFVVTALPLADAAIAPLVQPGTRVDLFSTGGDAESLAQNVRVVAVPAPATGAFGASGAGAALVEVTPDVAARLTVAAQTGGVAIALR
ncbi:SAF domain-containing protein [Propioniciclava soli]|uniref:SAF domain-containing protein n=1 Tax=Propioniciclava soli TaxID=2775081 RepID=UPI001E51C733